MALDLSVTPDTIAVTGASAQFATTLQDGELYTIMCSVGAWIQVGTNPTAVVGAPSQYVPPNYPTPVIAHRPNQKIAIIRDGASSGNGTLARGDME